VETVEDVEAVEAANNGSSNIFEFVKSATRKQLTIGSLIFSISMISMILIVPFLNYFINVRIFMIILGTSSCACLPIMFICSNENMKMYAKNKFKKVIYEVCLFVCLDWFFNN
jgi:uncharacterized membrane protein YgaE (UPF0421/DUF939 family)